MRFVMHRVKKRCLNNDGAHVHFAFDFLHTTTHLSFYLSNNFRTLFFFTLLLTPYLLFFNLLNTR
jgi:hypothetical protein